MASLVPAGTAVRRVRGRDPWQLIQARRAQGAGEAGAAPAGEPAPLDDGHDRSVRASLRELVRSAEAWCYHPDMAMPWIRPAVAAGLNACAAGRPDALWATAGPVSSFAVVERISRKTGLPYVLDFRDPWTITANDFEDRRPGWAVAADRRAMHGYLTQAQSVVFLYETVAQCYWEAYPGALDPSRVHLIPNGFEGAIDASEPAQNDKCTIVYTGTLSSYRYDTLVEALAELKVSDPGRAAQLRLLVMGESAAALAREVSSRGLTELIETRGAGSRSDVAGVRRTADALLILGRPSSMKGHELLVGAKLFDYLKSGKPILGVLPHDETRRTLQQLRVTTLADAGSPGEIRQVLTTMVDAWRMRRLPCLAPDRDACQRYSAAHQGRALVAALKGCAPVDRFVPGRTQVPASLRREIAGRARPAGRTP